MASYPGSLATFAGFVASHTLATDNHAAQHNLEQAEILAAQTKVGTGASTPTSGTVLRGTGAGTSAWAQAVLTTDVTGVLPVSNGGTGATSASDARTNLGVNTALEVLALAYPVGSIYINANDSTNPATLLGFGTWVAWGVGKAIVGIDTGQTEFDTAEETGGSKTHTLTEDEMPSHTHIQDAHKHTLIFSATAGGSGNAVMTTNGVSIGSDPDAVVNTTATNQNTGGGGAHNNLQPYQVGYVWKRTA